MKPYPARHLVVLLSLALILSLTIVAAIVPLTRGLAAELRATPGNHTDTSSAAIASLPGPQTAIAGSPLRSRSVLEENAPVGSRALGPSVTQVASSQALYAGLMLPTDTTYSDRVPAAAQFPARTLQPLALSGHIAFESDRTGDFGLYGRDADGSRSTVTLLNTTANEVTPMWSPDGKELLFASDRDGDYEIYRRMGDGSEVQLTFNAVDDIHPAWSLTGTEVVFASNRDSAYFGIYRMKSDGSDVRLLASVAGQNLVFPSYSPNGQRIAYMQASVLLPVCQWNWDVWVMNADGSNRRRVTSHLAADLYPHWTPDGRQIVYGACANFIDSEYLLNLQGRTLAVALVGSPPRLRRSGRGRKALPAPTPDY